MADEVHAKVLETLNDIKPDIVFAPATAFPEGMAAIFYRQLSGTRVVLMDDAWQQTDQRSFITRAVKRIIHSSVDAAFIPASSHLPYYESLNIPRERIFFGVDVVDNDYFSQKAATFRADEQRWRIKNKLPTNFFLFVGRFLPRKGMETLLEAYRLYREKTGPESWDLVLVGDGPNLEHIRGLSQDRPGLFFAGAEFGDYLCTYYALARVFIMPSELDPWALVVNEAMASGLPVIVSKGCGSAQTLVHEGENGWTFEPGDSASLARLMEQMTSLAPERLKAMGNESQKIIAEWSLDRYCHGVMEAIKVPRRDNAGFLSSLAVRLWKGRVSVN
jgi:glycosyltransferase involved in cell wall biosynthesis